MFLITSQFDILNMLAMFPMNVLKLKYLIKLMQMLCIRIMATAKHFTMNLLADLHGIGTQVFISIRTK